MKSGNDNGLVAASSSTSHLELVRKTLEADRARLNQVRKHVSHSHQRAAPPATTPKALTAASHAMLTNQENAQTNNNANTTVFDRLYEISKRPRSSDIKASAKAAADAAAEEKAFRPTILPKSRAIASRTDRSSLYERGLEQRQRHEMRIEQVENNLQGMRNRSNMSLCSRELSFNALRKELEQRFANMDSVDQDTLLNALPPALRAFDLFDRVTQDGQSARVQDLLELLFQVFCSAHAEDEEERASPDYRLRLCLVQLNQEIGNAARAQRTKQLAEQITSKLTPFRPQCISSAKSQLLDEQRMEKLGIDPMLPREEKILQVKQKTRLREEEAQRRWQEKERAECTFRPALCSSFTPTASSSNSSNCSVASHNSSCAEEGADASVVERLYQDSIRRRNRLLEKQQEKKLQAELSEVSECTFRPVLLSRKKQHLSSSLPATPVRVASKVSFNAMLQTEQSPPPPPTSLPPQQQQELWRQGQQNQSTRIVFQAEVALPNGKSDIVYVREGELAREVALDFAELHDLDSYALDALTRSLADALRGEEEEEEGKGEVAAAAADQVLTIDIVVREGETHAITVCMGHDPSNAARAFAKRYGMDREALQQLIDSLKSVVY